MSTFARHPGLCCPVLELRSYRMQPGGFDALHELFEKTFVRELEAAGMHLLGFFHQAGAEDRFVWIRGFDGLEERHAAYRRFYDGPVWKALRGPTNATLIDSSDVLLLRPVSGRGFQRSAAPDPAGPRTAPSGRIVASVLFLRRAPTAATRRAFADAVDSAGVESSAVVESEDGPNTWTRHPVRADEPVLAAFSWVDGPGVPAALERLTTRLAPLRPFARRDPESLVLEPTWMSRLR